MSRAARIEKEMREDRQRADHNLWASAKREDHIGRDAAGLKREVAILDREVQHLQKDVGALKKMGKRSPQVDAEAKWTDQGYEGTVKVGWERTMSSPRGRGRW